MSRVRSWKQLRFLIALVPAVLAGTTVRAESQSTPFVLAYSAPTRGCPAREEFVQAISVRAPAAREVTADRAALTLDVRLEGASERVKGSLTVRRPDGLSSLREVPEGVCAEVAESLAIIVAMLLEQREFEAPPSAANASQLAETSAATPAGPALGEPAALPEPPPPGRHSTPPRQAASTRTSASTAVHPRPPWGLAGTFASVLESEASPSLALGLLAGVEGWWVRDSLWSPSARLAAYQIDAGSEVTGQGSAHFRLRALRLSACPVRWAAHARLALHGCAVFDVGELWAQGEVARGKTLTMPWLAAGAGGRLALQLFPFLALEGEAVLQALSRHDEFVFQPNRFSVHSVAPVTLGAALGLTLRTF